MEPGKVYVNLLDQTEVWWTYRGELVNVDEMTPRHVSRLIGYFNREAKRLYRIKQMHLLRLSMGPYPDDDVFWEDEADPETWMKSRPLYKKLERMRNEQFQKELRRTILGDEGTEPCG